MLWKERYSPFEFIPDERVQCYFNSADIVAQTYPQLHRVEFLRLHTTLRNDAILTNVGGLSETIPHGKVGYVVSPNVNDIAEALIDFFENNRTEQFSENVRLEKRKYEWSRMVEALDRV